MTVRGSTCLLVLYDLQEIFSDSYSWRKHKMTSLRGQTQLGQNDIPQGQARGTNIILYFKVIKPNL